MQAHLQESLCLGVLVLVEGVGDEHDDGTRGFYRGRDEVVVSRGNVHHLAAAAHKFSKVRVLVHLPSKVAVERTFENLCLLLLMVASCRRRSSFSGSSLKRALGTHKCQKRPTVEEKET